MLIGSIISLFYPGFYHKLEELDYSLVLLGVDLLPYVAEGHTLVKEVVLGVGVFVGVVVGILDVGVIGHVLAGGTGQGHVSLSVFAGLVFAYCG